MNSNTLTDDQKDVMQLFVNHVDQVLNLIELYEPNRAGSLAFTKFEEGLMWAQIMISQNKKKELVGELVA